jgi:hypothetical protein
LKDPKNNFKLKCVNYYITCSLEYEKRNKAKEEKEIAVYEKAKELNMNSSNEYKAVNLN